MTASFWQSKRILVTGGAGFLGSYVVAGLAQRGVARTALTLPRSADCDFRVWENCLHATAGQDIVIHLAGVVGGIGYNRENPASLFYDNLIMGTQLMEAARQNGVRKFVAIGTVCAYPKFTPVPFQEADLWNGYPEETNAPYGLAKKMLLVQAQAYRAQYGFNAIYLLPVNLYGPGDNFNPRSGHVIPDMIRKCFTAKAAGADEIVLFGDGTPTREFLFAADGAECILLATERYDAAEPVNIGSAFEISIRDLAELIAAETGFRGRLCWDTTRPNGQPRRKLDITRAEREFGFRSRTSFRDGLRQTIAWYAATLEGQRMPANAAL
jgi:GDP-L-fucose synthase